MVNILGFDIGGVNIKVSFLRYCSQTDYQLHSLSKFYPMWLNDLHAFSSLLKELVRELVKEAPIDLCGITLTAEVSDAYETKKDGVTHVLSTFQQLFPEIPKKVISIYNKFLSIDDAIKDYLAVASANWVATALYIGKEFPKSILIDVGSTTTDIIPIRQGIPNTIGKTDTERLLHRELVYTGCLRATIPSIAHEVPYQGYLCPISFEKFALMADVHLLLGHISLEQYTCDTADGRPKTVDAAYARIARIICADLNSISHTELQLIAHHLYEEQLHQIIKALEQVLSTHPEYSLSDPVVITGLGRTFLAAVAAQRVGFKNIVDFVTVFGQESAVASPAAAIAMLLTEEAGGS